MGYSEKYTGGLMERGLLNQTILLNIKMAE
jgi:hypothetical protein